MEGIYGILKGQLPDAIRNAESLGAVPSSMDMAEIPHHSLRQPMSTISWLPCGNAYLLAGLE